MTNSTPILLDRLAGALKKHGVRLKRMQLLQVAAAALGHRNTHELAAADQADGLAPPAARYMGRTRVANIGWMHFFQDPDGTVFAVDQDRFDAQTGRAGNWLLSPFGGLVDVSSARVSAVQDKTDETPIGTAHDGIYAGDAAPSITNAAREVEVNGRPLVTEGATTRRIPTSIDGVAVVDLVPNPDVVLSIIGIQWDVDHDDHGPLPVDLLAGVPADWDDDQRFVDLLSDHYGYCIQGVSGSVEELKVDDHTAPGAVETLDMLDPTEPAYMTNGCCESASVTREDLTGLGLPWGRHEGEFYPLTDAEAAYIAEDVVDADDGVHGALIGYSVLYHGAKHLMPTIEIAYQTERDAPGEFALRAQVVPAAAAYADRIHQKVASIGGNTIIEDDGLDRVLIKILVPFERAMAMGDFDAWKARLAWIMVDPDLPTVSRAETVHHGAVFRAMVSWIGEGGDGDYDPNKPGDRPLLRFYADQLIDGEWEAIDGGSYCTQVPAWCSHAHTVALARYVVEMLEETTDYENPRHMLAGLSSTDITTVEAARQQQLVVNAMKQAIA